MAESKLPRRPMEKPEELKSLAFYEQETTISSEEEQVYLSDEESIERQSAQKKDHTNVSRSSKKIQKYQEERQRKRMMDRVEIKSELLILIPSIRDLCLGDMQRRFEEYLQKKGKQFTRGMIRDILKNCLIPYDRNEFWEGDSEKIKKTFENAVKMI